MKVLLVSEEYPPALPRGGVGAFTRALARALAAAGCDVTVISCSESHSDEVDDDDGVTVHRIRMPPRGRLATRCAVWLPDTVKRVRLARAVAAATRRLGLTPDVVEAPEWGAEGLLMRRAAGAPVVVHLHSSVQSLLVRRGARRGVDNRLAGLIERVGARRAAIVTAPSRLANDVVPGQTWVPVKRVRPVTMPLDPDLLAAPDGAFRGELIVMCGRLDQLKAPEVLVDAAALLTVEFPGLRVLCIGRDDAHEAPGGREYGEWLQERADRAGVALELTGTLPWEDVIDYYRRARVVAVPSRYETFSMVALEAMACATPVIVSTACGIAESMADLGAGWTVPPDDPAALAAAMRPMVGSADAAAAAGQRARAFALARFDPLVVARERLALYASIGVR